MATQSAIAGGTIFPYRFVKLDPTAEGRIVQCGAGEVPIGVSQPGTRRSPYIDQTDPPRAALVGEPIGYWDLAESKVGLEVVAACSPGDRLKSDTNGKGTPASGGDEYGAIAYDEAAAGDICAVQVAPGKG